MDEASRSSLFQAGKCCNAPNRVNKIVKLDALSCEDLPSFLQDFVMSAAVLDNFDPSEEEILFPHHRQAILRLMLLMVNLANGHHRRYLEGNQLGSISFIVSILILIDHP